MEPHAWQQRRGAPRTLMAVIFLRHTSGDTIKGRDRDEFEPPPTSWQKEYRRPLQAVPSSGSAAIFELFLKDRREPG
jgi:hypothetical protein